MDHPYLVATTVAVICLSAGYTLGYARGGWVGRRATRVGPGPFTLLDLLRANGWIVAVHNDYRQSGKQRTFWLMTHADGTYVKGEGDTDMEALRFIEEKVKDKAYIASKGDI